MQPLCRQQKRKCDGHQNWEALNGRCGGGPSRYVHTRSDAGTRSTAEPTSDGTRSTQSGFSAASAPLNTAGGLEEGRARSIRLVGCGSRSNGGIGFGGQHLRGRSGSSGGPQLPLIIDTRRRRRKSHGSSDNVYSGNNHRVGNRNRSCQGALASVDRAETCPECDAGNSSGSNNLTLTSAPADMTQGDGQYEEQFTRAREGYDGGAAATILRVARRRDPAGLNVNFEQFWTWKRRAAATSIDNNGKKGPQPTQNETPRHFTKKDGSAKEPAGGGGTFAAASKLETLARMKTVYMTKDNSNGGGCTPATTTASPRKYNPPYRPPPEPRPPDRAVGMTPIDGAAGIARSLAATGSRTLLKLSESTAGETSCTKKQNRGCGGGWIKSDEEGMTNPAADGTRSNFDETKAVVDVPDLELTESRIRQVDKYFGGSGGAGRHRRPAGEVGRIYKRGRVSSNV